MGVPEAIGHYLGRVELQYFYTVIRPSVSAPNKFEAGRGAQMGLSWHSDGQSEADSVYFSNLIWVSKWNIRNSGFLALTPGPLEFIRFPQIELFTRDHCTLWDSVDFFVQPIGPLRQFEFYRFVKIELFTRDQCTLCSLCFLFDLPYKSPGLAYGWPGLVCLA